MVKAPWYKRMFSPGGQVKFDEAVAYDLEQPQRVLVLQADPIGSYGTDIQAGYNQEEYLRSLQGSERADVFDKIRRGDYQAKMCLSAVKNPIKGADFSVEPGIEEEGKPATEIAKKQAAFIRFLLFEDCGHRSFRKFLSEYLTVMDFGHAVFEMTDKVVIGHKKWGSYNGIAGLGWRSPRTLERWNVEPATGNLKSVTQWAQGDLHRQVDMPAAHLLVFTLELEGANYEGISLLRPCYGPWLRKENYLKLNAIGIEKFAVPTPIAEIPDQQQNSPQFANLVKTLESYTKHQKNFITHPVGYKITLTTNAYDPQKVEVSIDNEDKRMTKAFLANFLELGMNSSGSYALSNDLSDFFLAGLDYIAAEFCEGINERVIKRYIDMNFGPQPVYPKLTHSGISDKAGKELAEMLTSLIGSKVITPDDPLEVIIRKRMKLPPKSDEGVRVPTPAAKPPGGDPGADPNPENPDDVPADQQDEVDAQLSERIRLAEQRRLKALRDLKKEKS